MLDFNTTALPNNASVNVNLSTFKQCLCIECFLSDMEYRVCPMG